MREFPKILRTINEALGVPENIYETSLKVFDRILNWTKTLKKGDFKQGQGARTIIRGDFRVADYEFSNVKVQLGIEKFEQLEEPELISMINRSESKKTEDFRLQTIKRKSVDLLILIGVPEDYKYKNISEFILSNKKEIVESLSHEIKHAYDHYKNPYDSTTKRAEYQAAISLNTGIPAVDKFIHDIYFSSVNENLVRPTEVASAIQNDDISQKEFLNFLKSNITYQTLKRLSNFNFETFKREILEDKSAMNSFLKHVGEKPKNLTDEQKLSLILEKVYQGISNAKIEKFSEMLTHNFFEQLMGFEGEKKKVFDRFVRQNSRFTNPEDFFKFYEKRFHIVGNEMLKKIAKLYAITKK